MFRLSISTFRGGRAAQRGGDQLRTLLLPSDCHFLVGDVVCTQWFHVYLQLAVINPN